MRAAVLGRPVSHSLSPLLHRAAYAALGLTDWTYDALDVGADDQRLDRTGTLTAPVVVSTVPAAGQPAVADLAWWRGQTVLDVLYAGWPTPLAQRVEQAGATTISGLEVLFWQAIAQV